MKINQFEIWYRNGIESRNERPPDFLWEDIENNLDINDVWTRIDKKLSAQQRNRKLLFLLPFAAAVLVFVSFVFILPTTQSPHTQQNALVKKELPNSAQRKIDYSKYKNSSQVSNIKANSTNNIKQNFNINNSEFVAIEEKVEILDTAYCADFVKEKEQNLFKNVEISLIGSKKEILNKVFVKNEAYLTKQTKKLSVGVIASYNNIWLLNNTTTSGLNRYELNRTNLDFGKAFGIAVCYKLGSKIAIQAECYFVSEIGQKYNEYISGFYTKREINLQYQTFDVAVKYIFERKDFREINSVINIVGGLYVAKLNLAKQIVATKTRDVSNNFSNYDYGFTIGAEYEAEITKKLIISSGLRLNFGLFNIWSGSDDFPAKFLKTHPASFGINIGLRYSI